MFTKTVDGKWINQNGEILENLDEYEDINDRVEHQVGDLATSLESIVGRIDYKIENHQLKFFGATLSLEFLAEIVFTLFSLVVGIIQ